MGRGGGILNNKCTKIVDYVLENLGGGGRVVFEGSYYL